MMMETLNQIAVDRDELDRLRWAQDVLRRLVTADMEGWRGGALEQIMREARECVEVL